MKTTKKKSFVTKKYNSLLIASLLGWVISLIGSLSDGILAGLLISEEAVAAIELVAPLFNILLFFAVLLGIGVSTLFSTYLGAFEKEKAARINGTGIVSALFAGVLFLVLMIVFKDAYFMFYGSSGLIDALGKEYYSCFYVLAFSYPVYWLIYYLVSADGDAGIVLLCDIITAVSNPVFSLLLVGRLGIVGLGYGTVLSNIVSIIVLAAHFFKKNNSIRFRLCFSISELVKVCTVGSSVSLAQIYLAAVVLIMNKFIITQFGAEYLAAYAVINLFLNFGGCLSCSMDAASPFVTVAYGESNYAAQRNILRITLKASSILGIIFTAAELLLAGYLPNLYGISTPQIYADAVYAGRVLAFMNLGMCFEILLGVYYPKINKPVLGNFYSIIYTLIAPLTLSIPLAYAGGFRGIVWGFFLTPFITLLLGYLAVSIKYGSKMYPFLITESDDKIFVHEIEIVPEEIAALNAEVQKELESCGVEYAIINRVQLMIEETFMVVREKNARRKEAVLADCAVIVNSGSIRLITRDNGMIFDITDVDADIHTLQEYVAARLIEQNSGAEYLTTISFNRNSFIWER